MSQPEFLIQRIYIKDLSFEAPHLPALFQEDWKPNIDLQVQIEHTALAENNYEVVLNLTITVTTAEKTAFLIQVQQAGIFTLKNFPAEHLEPALEINCPEILFPYARELITSLSTRGTFPPLSLAPLNFHALYTQKKPLNA